MAGPPNKSNFVTDIGKETGTSYSRGTSHNSILHDGIAAWPSAVNGKFFLKRAEFWIPKEYPKKVKNSSKLVRTRHHARGPLASMCSKYRGSRGMCVHTPMDV